MKKIEHWVSMNNALGFSSCPTCEAQPSVGIRIEFITSFQLENPSFGEEIIEEDAIVNASTNDNHFDSHYILNGVLKSTSCLVIS